MWTSHDTVGLVFLAGFCVQLGSSFEGKNCIFSSKQSVSVSSCRAALPGGSCSVGESVKSAQPFWRSKGGSLEENRKCFKWDGLLKAQRGGKSELSMKAEEGCAFLPPWWRKNATGDCLKSSHFTSRGGERLCVCVFFLAFPFMPGNKLAVKEYLTCFRGSVREKWAISRWFQHRGQLLHAADSTLCALPPHYSCIIKSLRNAHKPLNSLKTAVVSYRELK